MSIRNYMRLTLLDDSQELDNLDPVTGEEVNEEELAERTPEEDAQAAGEAIEELAEAQARKAGDAPRRCAGSSAGGSPLVTLAIVVSR